MKIIFLDAKTVGEVPNIHKISDLGEYYAYENTFEQEASEKIGDAEIIITNKVKIKKHVIDQCTSLKLICIAATGMDHVDVEYAGSKGIEVKNVAGYSTHSVAQHTFASLLYLMEQLNYYDDFVKSGQYAKSDIFTNVDREFRLIHNKRYGIIGMGAIGQVVAKIANAFGAEVIYYSSSGKNTEQPYKQVDFEEIISTADILSIHAPLNNNTKNLIDEKALQKMKNSALLLNTGRGGIVNEEALAEAVDNKTIAGAALDVYDGEPVNAENPLLKVKNKEGLVLTPHMAWTSIESRIMLIDKIAENIATFLNK